MKNIIDNALRVLKQWWCLHPEDIIRTDDSGRMYVECLHCGRPSKGIQTGEM